MAAYSTVPFVRAVFVLCALVHAPATHTKPSLLLPPTPPPHPHRPGHQAGKVGDHCPTHFYLKYFLSCSFSVLALVRVASTKKKATSQQRVMCYAYLIACNKITQCIEPAECQRAR